MRLYIGGYGQSKLSFVKSVEGIEKYFDGEKDDIKKIGEYRVINKLNMLIKRLLESGINVEEFVNGIEAEIIICDIVGNGVIPMNRNEEIYRNEVGRSCCRLAEKSDSVIRVICGIGQVIK